MLTTIKGYFEDGKVILKETPSVKEKTEVIVTFLTDEPVLSVKQRILGSLRGKIYVPNNFNEPLDDLKEYM